MCFECSIYIYKNCRLLGQVLIIGFIWFAWFGSTSSKLKLNFIYGAQDALMHSKISWISGSMLKNF